jgi:hypothetical protein
MEKPFQTLIHPALGEGAPRADGYTEARTLCAYNRTRGCILGVEVACGDFSFSSLLERMPWLTPRSGAGLWLDPFRGIPADDVSVPLDMIYLDADYRVLAVVELFPTYRVSPSTPPAASVLVLPTHIIFSSQTQAGDLVGFGLAEEAGLIRARLRDSVAAEPDEKNAPQADGEALDAPAARPATDADAQNAVAKERPEADGKPQPWMKPAQPKNWLHWLLWLFSGAAGAPRDPRAAARAGLPGLTAYFWTGGSPTAHQIRDISYTGLYVVTEERWYPGTLVQMTLKKSGGPGANAETSICLMARANRWGNDGVGLGFVVRDPRQPRGSQNDSVSREELDRFLACIKQKK